MYKLNVFCNKITFKNTFLKLIGRTIQNLYQSVPLMLVREFSTAPLASIPDRRNVLRLVKTIEVGFCLGSPKHIPR